MSETSKTGSEEVSYIVKSAVRDYFKKASKRVDAEIFTELNHVVEWKLRKAAHRAEKNKRATVRPEDI